LKRSDEFTGDRVVARRGPGGDVFFQTDGGDLFGLVPKIFFEAAGVRGFVGEHIMQVGGRDVVGQRCGIAEGDGAVGVHVGQVAEGGNVSQ